MFQELKSLLVKRPLTITIAMLDNEQIRLNVVPHPGQRTKKSTNKSTIRIRAKSRPFQKRLLKH